MMAETFTLNRKKMNYLYIPESGVGKHACCNLGYQMQHSVRTLEEQLLEEGSPHVLQLNMFNEDDPADWKNPTRWNLYADGKEVANGDGAYARDCFRTSAEAFRDLCREIVERASLPSLDERDYRLLRMAREVARYEAFDNGTHVFGSSSQMGRA